MTAKKRYSISVDVCRGEVVEIIQHIFGMSSQMIIVYPHQIDELCIKLLEAKKTLETQEVE